MNKVKGVIGLIVIVGLIWFFFGGGLEKQAANEMQKLENQVATDAEEQCRIAKKNGSPMDAYVQASTVAAAYLQAKDEENYKKWKGIERQEAKLAGVPIE